jgi:hypothetical protein
VRMEQDQVALLKVVCEHRLVALESLQVSALKVHAGLGQHQVERDQAAIVKVRRLLKAAAGLDAVQLCHAKTEWVPISTQEIPALLSVHLLCGSKETCAENKAAQTSAGWLCRGSCQR